MKARKTTKEVGAFWKIGKSYFVRTVTYHVVGTLRQVTPTELIMEPAAWVADSGRWSAALRKGELSEVEPFCGPVLISRGAIADATRWDHAIPTEVK